MADLDPFVGVGLASINDIRGFGAGRAGVRASRAITGPAASSASSDPSQIPSGFVMVATVEQPLFPPLLIETVHPGARITGVPSAINVEDRPGKTAIVTFTSGQPRRMVVPVILEGIYAHQTWRILERMAMNGGQRPRRLQVLGAAPYTTLYWLLEPPELDPDTLIVDTSHQLLRGTSTLSFVQDVRPDALTPADPDDPAVVAAAEDKPQYAVAKQGDTLRDIAKRKQVYGDARQWQKLAQANGLRDPEAKIPEGTRLIVPR